jgi:hypothetical protein
MVTNTYRLATDQNTEPIPAEIKRGVSTVRRGSLDTINTKITSWTQSKQPKATRPTLKIREVFASSIPKVLNKNNVTKGSDEKTELAIREAMTP